MKIFDWMHLKLHRNVDYCMVTPPKSKKDFNSWGAEKKKAATLTCDKDTKALLLHQAHVAPIDEWHDGILAIGTLGLVGRFEEYSSPEKEYPSAEEEAGEEGPDASAVVTEETDEVLVKNNESDDMAIKEMVIKSSGEDVATSARVVNPLRQFIPTEEMNGEDADMGQKMKQNNNNNNNNNNNGGGGDHERTTLADLFSADADEAAAGGAGRKCINAIAEKEKEKNKNKKKIIPSAPAAKKQFERRTKHVRSLAKKLVPWKGDDSRPTAKLHQLLTKMLKKKIHPELNTDEAVDGDNINRATPNGKPVHEQEMIYMNGTNEPIILV